MNEVANCDPCGRLKVVLPPAAVSAFEPLAHVAVSTPVSSSTTADSTQPWYVCLTKPRQEVYAVLKLQEQGFQTYMPLLETWSRRKGQWVKKQNVMFPRYAFVRPESASHSLSTVRSTPGVTTLVKFGTALACISHNKLSALKALLADQAASQPGQPMQPGQQVVFASGPLKGLAGVVSSAGSDRITVLLTMLGRAQTVAVPADHLAFA